MKTVLMIDRKDDSRGLVSALEGEGFRVMVEAESGDGLRRASEDLPGVIIIDEDMPPINGVALLTALRSFSDTLIVVKGSGEGLAKTQALLQGADVYLPWCSSIKEALVRISAAIRRLGTANEPA